MSKTYNLKVNSNFEFKKKINDLEHTDVLNLTDKKAHVLANHQSYEAEVVSANFNAKTYSVSVNNNLYEVKIEDDLDLLIKEMGFEVGAGKVVNAIKAPMPGLILEISISEGEEVAEGDTLLILEAMKMENALVSPRAGIITKIEITKGQAVDKGDLLIEFE